MNTVIRSRQILQLQSLKNLLREGFVLHDIPVDFLELDAMQAEQRDLNDEDFKVDRHVLRHLIADVRGCRARISIDGRSRRARSSSIVECALAVCVGYGWATILAAGPRGGLGRVL